MRGRYAEVYVFRPGELAMPAGTYVMRSGESLVGADDEWLRYADGLWLPDDGQYDLAFVSTQRPIALGVALPVWDGVEWSWRDPKTAYAAVGVESSLVNSWHRQVVDPTEGDGNYVGARGQHRNGVAYEAAMDKCSKLHSCGNGRGPRFELGDEWFAAGLVRTLSGETVRPPEHPVCYLCANDGAGHKLLYLRAWQEDAESKLDYARERVEKLRADLAEEQDEVTLLTERLAAFDAAMQMEVACAS
jgi:hypothetical protein